MIRKSKQDSRISTNQKPKVQTQEKKQTLRHKTIKQKSKTQEPGTRLNDHCMNTH